MMQTKKMKECRAVPERTCIGCGQKRSKDSLRRVAIDNTGHLLLDTQQRAPGRGAYLCGSSCLKTAGKRKAFQRAFRGRANALELTNLERLLQPGS